MKQIALLLGWMALAACSGCRVSDVREMTVAVPGMAAEADVQKIRQALAVLNGVNKEQAVFDTAGRKIVVTYDSMVVAKKNIEIAIAEAGYDANSVAAIKAAPAK